MYHYFNIQQHRVLHYYKVYSYFLEKVLLCHYEPTKASRVYMQCCAKIPQNRNHQIHIARAQSHVLLCQYSTLMSSASKRYYANNIHQQEPPVHQ